MLQSVSLHCKWSILIFHCCVFGSHGVGQAGWEICPETEIIPAEAFAHDYFDITARIGDDIKWKGTTELY